MNKLKNMVTRQLESFLIIFSLCSICLLAGYAQGSSVYQYPPIETENIADTLFQKVIPDPYRFLENPEDARTRQFIVTQTQFLESQKKEIGNESHFCQRAKKERLCRF